MTIIKFEEIKAWQEARNLTNMIYDLSKIGEFRKDFGLTDQIRRAAVSIMSNIAEGFLASTKKEFKRFLFISLRSAAEVQSQLYVALDQHYIDRQKFNQAYEQADKTARHVRNFIKYLSKDIDRKGTNERVNK